MKRASTTVSCALIIASMVGCRDTAELEAFRTQTALEDANRALAERYIDAASRADEEAPQGILSPDYVHHPELGVDESLKEALTGLRQRVRMFPDQSLSVEDLFARGNKVAWRGVFRGTHTGDIEGFPATGKAVEMRGFQILRVESGRIAEAWGSRDLFSLYQQLGFELRPTESN